MNGFGNMLVSHAPERNLRMAFSYFSGFSPDSPYPCRKEQPE